MFNLYLMTLLRLIDHGHWTSRSRTRNIITLINQRAYILANLN